MKKENIGKKIIYGVIAIILVGAIVFMIINSNQTENNQNQEAPYVANEVERNDNPGNRPIEQRPEEILRPEAE